jgi:PKD repeat protein
MRWNAPSIGAVRILLFALALLLVLAAPAGAAPDPSYQVTPDPPVAGQPATFTSTSTSTTETVPPAPVAITRVRWDFVGNDNFEQKGAVVTHTYASAGIKTFRMRVTDALGEVTTESFTITVSGSPLPAETPPLANRLPVAQFSVSDVEPEVGHQVALRSFSYDPDGTITAQRWDLDGDGDFDENATGPTAFTVFSAAGPRIVRLEVRDSSGAVQTETQAITVKPRNVAPVTASGLSLLNPFPIVRLAGSVYPRGVKVRLLEAKAPRRSTVTVRCAGSRCPAKRITRTSTRKPVRFRSMIRFLRAGTIISVSITKRGQIGKYTRWLIRGGKVPKRKDLCLYPGRGKPARCPLS